MSDYHDIYNRQAAQYDRLVTREDTAGNLLPAIERIIPLAGLAVVELGAGTGRLTCLLAPRVDRIQAFDRSEHMLALAADKLRAAGFRNWQTAAADNRRSPATDSAADLALAGWSVCYLVAEHPRTWQAEVDAVLAEMRRVLRPGGISLLIETLGTGCEQPDPPASLIPYYAHLEARGFQRAWIRSDYRFSDRREAETLTCFFFGDRMAAKIRVENGAVILPECTGLWWMRKA